MSSHPSPAEEQDPDKTLPVEAPRPSEVLRGNAGNILGRLLGDLPGGDEEEGDEIGPYRLRELLGEGGFGLVWRAEQSEPVRREVALKVIKPGMDTVQVLARFCQERQALASFDHPGIARLLNAGVTQDGRPWFAMEMVRGGPITDWCEEQHATLQQRLRLFILTCEAVQHAHDKGVLHRDLKPTNILVAQVDGRPVPRVIDFGIAKAIAYNLSPSEMTMVTQADQVVGTPLYMAPEQLDGGREVDARTDVYALGILLYKLITGVLPVDLSVFKSRDFDAMKRHIQETPPERPSSRLRQCRKSSSQQGQSLKNLPLNLPADLDWITLRALEKSRERRYASARELAADVQRFLDHQRVMARPPGLAYGASRWLRRHRSGVLAAAASSVLSVLVIAGALLWKNSHIAGSVKTAADGSYTNSLGMKFVPVPGTDVMFCIHETRYRDYASFANSLPYTKAPGWMMQDVKGHPCGSGDDDAVISVNWDDAQKFCLWLSHKEGKLFRLPTDHEWSLAAGTAPLEAGEGTPALLGQAEPLVFSFGPSYPPKLGSRAGNYLDATMRQLLQKPTRLGDYDDGFATVAPVMSFQSNPAGLFDMSGNVWEWCEDKMDPQSKDRVTRGGSWEDDSREMLTLTARRGLKQDSAGNQTGFRCVLVPGGTPPPLKKNELDLTYKPPPPFTPPHPAAISALQAQDVPKFPESLNLAEAEKQAFTNSLGMKLLPVPGTSTLFCIHETRYKDYAAYAAATPGLDNGWETQTILSVAPVGNKAEHPVFNVNWQDAQGFCAWLSRKEGKTYRLPTDREWSYAVGIGAEEAWQPGMTPQHIFKVQNQYPWGGSYPPKTLVGNYNDESRGNENRNGGSIITGYNDGFTRTAPVMSFPPNKHGLFDMGGNVMEWCEDGFDNRHMDVGLRGAAWHIGGGGWTLSSFRMPSRYTQRSHNTGFRIVMEP